MLDNQTIMWIITIVIIVGLIITYNDLQKCYNPSYGGLVLSSLGVLASCVYSYYISQSL